MPNPTNRKALTQIVEMFRAIPSRRLILIGSTAVLVGLAVFGLAYYKRNGDFRPLYKALSPEDAGGIVAKLKEKDIPYQVSDDGATVLVPQAKVAEARLEMAAAGLPKSGRIGFELFDQTKFGATDFMEHVNYRRALEGELERTLMAMSEVEQARVHLTFAKDSVYTENRLPAKGSVVLKLRSALSEQTVSAVRYMISSAVEGLAPEAVSVVDMRGHLLGRPKEKTASDGDEPSEAALEYRHNVEKDLLNKVNSTIEPLLGAERFRSSVSAECDFTSGELSEETYDPARQAVSSDQRSKETSTAGSANGVPGTQSNLPRATPRPGTNTQVTRETSNTTYQTTHAVRRTKTPQGTLKRISVAVLVDQTAHWEGRGPTLRRVLTPPSKETIDRITEVVSAAVGIVVERGDRVVVDSLPFETTQDQPPPEALQDRPPTPDSLFNGKIIMTGIALLALAAALTFVVRSQRRPGLQAEVSTTLALPAAAQAPAPAQPALTPLASAAQIAKQLEGQRQLRSEEHRKELEAAGAELQALTESAISMTQTNSELCAGVLRSWLNDKQEPLS
jgi:flagellar M-ring protein FliF